MAANGRQGGGRGLAFGGPTCNALMQKRKRSTRRPGVAAAAVRACTRWQHASHLRRRAEGESGARPSNEKEAADRGCDKAPPSLSLLFFFRHRPPSSTTALRRHAPHLWHQKAAPQARVAGGGDAAAGRARRHVRLRGERERVRASLVRGARRVAYTRLSGWGRNKGRRRREGGGARTRQRSEWGWGLFVFPPRARPHNPSSLLPLFLPHTAWTTRSRSWTPNSSPCAKRSAARGRGRRRRRPSGGRCRWVGTR